MRLFILATTIVASLFSGAVFGAGDGASSLLTCSVTLVKKEADRGLKQSKWPTVQTQDFISCKELAKSQIGTEFEVSEINGGSVRNKKYTATTVIFVICDSFDNVCASGQVGDPMNLNTL